MSELKEYKTCISSANLADTGFSYTLSLISGKYKMTISIPSCVLGWFASTR